MDCLNCKHKYNNTCNDSRMGAGYACSKFEFSASQSAVTGIVTGVSKFLNWR